MTQIFVHFKLTVLYESEVSFLIILNYVFYEKVS